MNNKYNCKTCNYATNVLCNYNKHTRTQKHILATENRNLKNTSFAEEMRNDEDYGEEMRNDEDYGEELRNGEDCEECIGNKRHVCDNNYILCKYCKQNIFKSNISRHLKSCNKKMNTYNNVRLNPNQISCMHCLKPISINNKARHQNNCKHKKNNTITLSNNISTELVTTSIEEKLQKIDSDLSKIMKNNTNNYNTCNVYYVMNNCPDALDFNKLMDAPITSEELRDLNENSAIVGSINFLLKRCVADVNPRDRPFHLADESRGKYCVKLGNDWSIDSKGDVIINKLCEILKSVYLSVNKNDSPEMIMAKNNKFKDLYDNRKKILNCITQQVLLKNNSKLMLG
jgi:hypothetical protein